jgi:hypothetical protein
VPSEWRSRWHFRVLNPDGTTAYEGESISIAETVAHRTRQPVQQLYEKIDYEWRET